MIRGKYNQYGMKKINQLIAAGAEAAKIYRTEEELIYSTSYSPSEIGFVIVGFRNPSFVPGEIREYYRIGEPRVDEYDGTYRPSYNFSENRWEDGVSVVTTGWLHSMKSVFFNTTDEKIEARGVWKIKGFALPSGGGDGEVLICPVDWAEKTRIKTRNGLEKAVRKSEI